MSSKASRNVDKAGRLGRTVVNAINHRPFDRNPAAFESEVVGGSSLPISQRVQLVERDRRLRSSSAAACKLTATFTGHGSSASLRIPGIPTVDTVIALADIP